MSEGEELLDGDWSAVTRIEVWPGWAHFTWPRHDGGPWRVIDDPGEVAALVAALREARPAPGLPAPVLSGVRLCAYAAPSPVDAGEDDDRWVDCLDLVAPDRAGTFERDFVLPAPLPPQLFGRPPADLWAPHLEDAVARAERGEVPAGLPELTEAWDAAWPGSVPLSFLLRGRPRWVRFHSLPESKRYADTDDEDAEILRRHRAVLADLAGSARDVLVVTASWSGSPMPDPLLPPVAAATPGARFWRSVTEPGDDTVWHLYVERKPVDAAHLDTLFGLVADDVTRVLVGDLDWAWLYAPYDGGADVFARTEQQRDELKARYADWLPQNSAGL